MTQRVTDSMVAKAVDAVMPASVERSGASSSKVHADQDADAKAEAAREAKAAAEDITTPLSAAFGSKYP